LLILIGARGTGKTTVAGILARKLGWPWLDADSVLEERVNASIRGIFAEEGESAFRDRESAILAELCELRRHVIAAGGGVVLRAANRERLKAAGRVVWLTADPLTLQARLAADPVTQEQRPMLTVGGLAEIEETLRTREGFYRDCADLTVATAGRSPEEVADAILTELPCERGV
jgi:shikimate kinase